MSENTPHLLPGQLRPGVPFVVPTNPVDRKVFSGNARALASMPFSEAMKHWLDSRERVLKGRTPALYRHQINILERFFVDMKPDDIHVGHMIAYQEARLINADGRWKRIAGPSAINHELSLVQQLLKRAGLWSRIAGLYRRLPLMPLRPSKVMTDIEEKRFFAVAASKPSFELAFHVATLTANTTSAGTELRHLRFEDVKMEGLEPRMIVDPATAKNVYRGPGNRAEPSST